MHQYLDMLKHILDNGEFISNGRTKEGYYSVFGYQTRYNLREGFPAVTTKKLFFRGVAVEMIWFLSGDTNVKYLQDNNVHIWDEWATKEQCAKFGREEGDLGPIYGKLWRKWEAPIPPMPNGAYEEVYYGDGHVYAIDQIERVINRIKTNPSCKRLIVTGWDPANCDKVALPPCFQAGTLVATSKGYKPIEEITENDLVLDADGNYNRVVQTWKTPYSGEMVSLLTWYKNEPLISTPNHPYLVRGKGFVDASAIQEGDFLGIPRNSQSVLPSFTYSYNCQNKTIVKSWMPNVNDFFTFGYFLGDGWCSGNRVSFAVSNKDKGEILPKIRTSIKVSQKPEKKQLNCYTYETKSLKWSSVLKDFGKGAKNKCIPAWVLNAPTETIEAFLAGYEAADGHFDGHGKRFTTISPSIAYGVQLLFAKLGYVASVRKQKKPLKYHIQGREVNQNDLYHVSMNEKTYVKTKMVDDQYLWLLVRRKEAKNMVAGQVFNLEIENSHTYTVANMANHNCHTLFQFRVSHGGTRLNCQLYQRSADAFLGVPFNIASYALLTHMVAQVTGLEVGEFIHTFGDLHIYANHVEQVKEQLQRQPMPLPQLWLDPSVKVIDGFKPEHIKLLNYQSHTTIKGEVAV